jgi:N-acetylglucosamine-6-phosphate deacetylase
MDDAVANLMTFADVGLVDAVAAATSTPARVLGLEDERGTLRPGAVGDAVLLDPAGLDVVATVVAGQVAYDRRV